MPELKSADPDDLFADSRMSFGDHLDELRSRMIKALKALAFFLVIGFVLDGVGYMIDWPNFGIGRPMFFLMTKPVEDQVRDYYFRSVLKNQTKLDHIEPLSDEDLARIERILSENENDLSALSSSDFRKLLSKPETLRVIVPADEIGKVATLKDPEAKSAEFRVKVYPGEISSLGARGEALMQNKRYLTTLSVQEPFIVYMKVSMLCGVVLGSPFIFFQFWAFVAAGLHTHEKRYVHIYLPFSLGLFLAGVLICQFLVMPNAVKGLLGLNSFLGVDPDIRLNEWLSFALILPLVFGVSFQTPLIMVFLNRIGIFSHHDYLRYWRAAAFILMVVAIIILPTPDVMTMLYLYIPMFGLYMLGVAICKYFPPSHERYAADDSDQAAV